MWAPPTTQSPNIEAVLGKVNDGVRFDVVDGNVCEIGKPAARLVANDRGDNFNIQRPTSNVQHPMLNAQVCPAPAPLPPTKTSLVNATDSNYFVIFAVNATD